MNKFIPASKCFTFLVVVSIFSLVPVAHTLFSQPEEKFSIENKVLQEKPPASFAYSALAPESVFSNPEHVSIYSEQLKHLIQTFMERKVKEREEKMGLSHEPLLTSKISHQSKIPEPLIQKKRSDEVRKELMMPKKEEVSLPTQRVPKRVFPVRPKKDSELQLIRHNDLQGTINTLSYERIEGRGVRFRYTQIPEDFIGHFWWFGPQDLRGKTVRIFYSGLVPSEITFLVRRSYSAREAAYRFHLEDSPETRILSFQVPNKFPFKDVSIFELRIEKARSGKPYGDFLIEEVDVVESGEGSTSIKTDNEPKPFAFGGPYLQSNIWGGEVKAS